MDKRVKSLDEREKERERERGCALQEMFKLNNRMYIRHTKAKRKI